MNSKLFDIIPDNPDQRCIDIAVDELRNGGIICYPTDTVYGWVPFSVVREVVAKHGGTNENGELVLDAFNRG